MKGGFHLAKARNTERSIQGEVKTANRKKKLEAEASRRPNRRLERGRKGPRPGPVRRVGDIMVRLIV